MLTVAAGDPLIELVHLACDADQPLLLEGPHGIGKSELLVKAAARRKMKVLVRDLSLMEPPDLVGIPTVDDDRRTNFAPPAFLPQSGRGLLVLEELNRCPRYMQSPCLQLLTTRQLNDYRLPPRWLPCAAVNDLADGYHTDELDQALLSRFLRVKVVADVGQWVAWAADHGVHRRIVEFVEQSPGVFDDANSNPRAWTYASRLLQQWEQGERQPDLLSVALSGVLTENWALAFIQYYLDRRQPLAPEDILHSYHVHRSTVRRWVDQGQLDVAAASWERLKRYLQPQPAYDGLTSEQRRRILSFLGDLPPDLKRQARQWLTERGFTKLVARRRSR